MNQTPLYETESREPIMNGWLTEDVE